MRRLILVVVAVLAVACGGETVTGPDAVQHRVRPVPTPEPIGHGGGNGCPVQPGPWCGTPLRSVTPPCWHHVTERPNLCQITCAHAVAGLTVVFTVSPVVSCAYQQQ